MEAAIHAVVLVKSRVFATRFIAAPALQRVRAFVNALAIYAGLPFMAVPSTVAGTCRLHARAVASYIPIHIAIAVAIITGLPGGADTPVIATVLVILGNAHIVGTDKSFRAVVPTADALAVRALATFYPAAPAIIVSDQVGQPILISISIEAFKHALIIKTALAFRTDISAGTAVGVQLISP